MGKGFGWVAVCALVALGGSSCSSLRGVFDRGGDHGLEEVDSLLGTVERAHLECELSKAESSSALDALHTVVAPDFRGDAIMAYEALVVTLERSLEQAEALRETIEPMDTAAERVAVDWEADLAAFGSEVMREKSRARLAQTTTAYLAVQQPLRAAAKAYDVFNVGLADHVLYLEHDLNPSAVAAIEDELVTLTALQADLDAKLELCMGAASDYVRAAALNGQLAPPGPAPAAEPETVAVVTTSLRNKPAK